MYELSQKPSPVGEGGFCEAKDGWGVLFQIRTINIPAAS